MVGVVYIGNNPQSEERLKYLPGKHVIFKKDYSEAASECNTRKLYDHYIIFLEKTSPGYDTAAITYLKQNCQGIYIILLTSGLSSEERKQYQQCGINDTLDINASVTVISKKLQFVCDREDMLFDTVVTKRNLLQFKIPVWKRLFDIFVSSLAILVTSPIMIITAIAIKLESPGPALFKSKRVGTSYQIFDFLKFRSMYVDAEKRLQELSKTGNQYTKFPQVSFYVYGRRKASAGAQQDRKSVYQEDRQRQYHHRSIIVQQFRCRRRDDGQVRA